MNVILIMPPDENDMTNDWMNESAITVFRRRAVFPPPRPRHRQHDTNVVLDRVCLHGGQITFATIRFPPNPTTTTTTTTTTTIGDDDHVDSLDTEAVAGGAIRREKPTIDKLNNNNCNEGNVVTDDDDNHHLLRCRNGGRIVFARGPWIESHPLVRSHVGHDDAQQHHQVYKILAFGQGKGGGGKNDVSVGSSKLECVRGMIFPSSTTPFHSSSSSSMISIIAYGGRRISFLFGGGLWDKQHPRNSGLDNVDGKDDFGYIPINNGHCPYLEVSDWVHDIRMLPINEQHALTSSSSLKSTIAENGNRAQLNDVKVDNKGSCFLLAMGMANNSCEIWGFRLMLHPNSSRNDDIMTLLPSRLQCITCDVRCMTYSLSLYGWDCDNANNVLRTHNDGDDKCESGMSIAIPTLTAASGTVFGDIIIWSAVDNLPSTHITTSDNYLPLVVENWLHANDVTTNTGIERPPNTTSRIRISPIACLKGHLGSVLRVKFSSCGNFLASTSDDRTVRLWGKMLANNIVLKNNVVNDKGTNNSTQTSSSHGWKLVWTGWGHSARVLDVAFAMFPSSNQQKCETCPILVSAGEDGTARIWSPLMSEKEIAQPLRGHRYGSIWSVDVNRGIVITGGNDGSVKLYELQSRMKQLEGYDAAKTFVVPQDPVSMGEASAPSVLIADDVKESKLIKKKKVKPQQDHGQIICGMEFYGSYDEACRKLLIATRTGGLFSLDLASSAWTDYSSWSEHVVMSSDNERLMRIDPMSGSCIGVHPNGKSAIIGTTVGWLVISSICESTSPCHQDVSTTSCKRNISFQVPSLRPVQSVSFVDRKSILVFYSRGSVVWFDFDQSPVPIHILTLGTTGIPLSFAYDFSDNSMYIGDSRGNVAYFDLNNCNPVTEEVDHHLVKVNELRPASLLTTVHGKEHVTGITILKSSGIIVSIGNDGCMHQIWRDKSTNQLQKMTSIPVPNASGLRHVWNVSDPDGGERVIIGGFYGNDFFILDPILGYEFLRVDTGGRQRRHNAFFGFPNNTAIIQYPIIFGIAILAGWKNGFNSIEFHSSCPFLSTLANVKSSGNAREDSPYSPYSVGSPLHADINGMSWIGDMLLTGSNDCTVTLSKFDGTNLVSVAELPPHESCVRGVCSSRHEGSCLALLVTCGGKLSMEFYLLDTSSSASINNGRQMTGKVSLLCSYRTLIKATIDHRMNTVRATPLFPREKRCHLVVSGDSDGNLHVCVISECPLPRKTTVGTILQGNGRPVLCIELLRALDKVVAFVGTTDGEIAIWMFPGSVDGDSDAWEKELDGTLPTSPMFSYSSHQSGVNDISASVADALRPLSNVVVCTVGDDQSLSTCVLRFPGSSGQSITSLAPPAHILLMTECASASALKAVQLVMDSSTFNRIYTTGHDKQLTLWHLNISHDAISVKFASMSPLGIEGNCIDYACCSQEDGSVHETIAVGGEGVEVQSFNHNILHAACKLHEANYLLITAGAGFSSDSGLSTYECAPIEYREMCNPSKLVDNPLQFQQFWFNSTRAYLETKPHIGYELLVQWCGGGRLRHLRRSTCDRDGSNSVCSVPWWVYSSNVDGHFCLFDSFSNYVCEIHGSALKYRCACGIGYANGKHRLGHMWDKWNERTMLSSSSCKNTTVKMTLNQQCDLNNSDTSFVCSHCLLPMRPNVLMFHDTDENVLGSIDTQRERYQTWESFVEDEVAHHGAKLVILEIGCGGTVPAVRRESEEVLSDSAKKIATLRGTAGSVSLIRINPKDAAIEMNGESCTTISIASTAAATLCTIDSWLKALDT